MEILTGRNSGPVIRHPGRLRLTQAIPEIETYTRLYKPNDVVVRNEENGTIKTFTEKNVLAVDSNFLQVFDFGILEGNGNTALMKNGSVVITENIAKKYFGNIKAIGQTLLIGQNNKPFVVTAVTRNVPPQSSIQFDILTPVADYPVIKQFSWSWVWQQMICYVKLKNNISTDAANIRAIESKFPAVVRVQATSAFKRIGNPFDEFIKNGGKWNFHLMPFTDVHLRSSKVSIPGSATSAISNTFTFSAALHYSLSFWHVSTL
ncbi:MAG: ABC transporter permease [Ferruginibacter sp.]